MSIDTESELLTQVGSGTPISIDADTHVFEINATWDYLLPEHEKFRPKSVASTDNGPQQFWAIEGRLHPKKVFKQSDTGTSEAASTLADPIARVRHMDELGVGYHVIYPTLLLTPVTEHPETEVAMHRSYNRWMADQCSRSGGRLRWVAVLPYRSIELVEAEMNWAADNGACGVLMRALECDLPLSHPYFFPIYAAAERYGLAVCIHAGHGSPTIKKLYEETPNGPIGARAFSGARLTVVAEALNLLINEVPAKFPGVRWGFIEASSGWVPFLYHYLASRLRRMNKVEVSSCPELFAANQFFVTCQTDDDLPYVLEYAGASQLIIGSDYGHADSASDLRALQGLRQSKLSDSVVDKIVNDNPRRLYGI